MKTENYYPITENGLNEYLLIAKPDKTVYEKVMAGKQFFYDEYKDKIAIKTEPHITITNFVAKEAMEDTIIRWMANIFNKQQSFPVALNNYSGFPPHTIYLHIQNAQPFQQLAKELKVVNTYVRSCACPPMKIISNPHVSISSRLPEEVYFRALIQYSYKSFHESFIVNELLLLRRKHQYDTCKPVNYLYPSMIAASEVITPTSVGSSFRFLSLRSTDK